MKCVNIRMNGATIKKINKYISKCMPVFYKHNVAPACFGQSCGHPQWGALQRMDTSSALQRMDTSKYYKSL